MERETYLILRMAQPRGLESYDPVRSAGDPYDMTPKGGLAPVYQIQTETLDQQDYREAQHDQSVAALAPPIPLRLIAPVAAEEPGAQAADAAPHIHGAAWGVYATGALQSRYTGAGVTVAVLDTGIDAAHEAFRGVTLIQKDFTGEGDGDENGHGTHVAGTIFGQTVGDVRIGVAHGVRRALIGKVLGMRHSASTAEMVKAIQWAITEGAHIVNMSLEFDFPRMVRDLTAMGMEVDLATSKALAQYRDNVRFFDKLGEMLRAQAAQFSSALVIAAAGNGSRRQIKRDYVIEVAPPAAADGFIAVAALQSAGAPHERFSVAAFSNIRAAVAAPGVEVYSAWSGGGYTHKDGTSMAAPHVAGVAALWAEQMLQRQGVVRPDRLATQLLGKASSARIMDANYYDVGEGLVTAPGN